LKGFPLFVPFNQLVLYLNLLNFSFLVLRTLFSIIIVILIKKDSTLVIKLKWFSLEDDEVSEK